MARLLFPRGFQVSRIRALCAVPTVFPR